MFERFTSQARDVVVHAQDEARRLRHNYIGPEHLLLALFRVEDGFTRRVFDSLGMSVEEARAHVVRAIGEGDEAVLGQVPFTPRAKKTLELALRESLALGNDYIGPEHILVGLLRAEGVEGRPFDPESDSEPIREGVKRLLSEPRDRPERGLHVVAGEAVPGRPAWTLLSGRPLFAVALGLGILIGWAIWGH